MGKEIELVVKNNKAIFFLHRDYYEAEAIRAAAYKFTDLVYVEISHHDDWETKVSFELKDSENEGFDTIYKQFMNEVLDQQVRLDLLRRYGNIRDMIVKKAFEPVTARDTNG